MLQSNVPFDLYLKGFPELKTEHLVLRELRPKEDAAHWRSLLPEKERKTEAAEGARVSIREYAH
ncbi:hypothetical protein JXA32_08410 [Candidatus Sumerlaeota bacterium]|nr:hypothetical protein [Candidatus Sumerlaeota bacterium]